MNRLEALNELLVKVEAGKPIIGATLRDAMNNYANASLVNKANLGGINAAFALKEAVLGGEWGNDLASHGADGWLFMLTKYHSHIRRWAVDDDLATAILIAVIKALIWEVEQAALTLGGN